MRFLLFVDGGRIVRGSGVINLDNRQYLRPLTIVLERRSKDKPNREAGVSIVSVRNYQQQKTNAILYGDPGLPSPANEFLFDLDNGREWSKAPDDNNNNNQLSYWPLPVRPIVIQAYPGRLATINIIGEAYIFIHDVDSNSVKVYYRSARDGPVERLRDASVFFSDIRTKETMPVLSEDPNDPAAGFEWIERRPEFGNGSPEESWETASADVKQSIVSRADAATARALCQTDRHSRAVCRDRLPIREKSRLCLGNTANAQECDLIPMFSQQQFQSLVPKSIEIYADDPVQMTHEFYSQNYKLPTEGFSVALRKAKIMNTICAITRPDFLVTPEAATLHLPSYIDPSLLDSVIEEYRAGLKQIGIGDGGFILMAVRLYDANTNSRIKIDVAYNGNEDLTSLDVYRLNINLQYLPLEIAEEFLRAVHNDKYLANVDRLWADTVAHLQPILPKDRMGRRLALVQEPVRVFKRSRRKKTAPNAFHLSRLVKIAMDLGYFHNADVYIESARGTRKAIPI